MRNVYKGMRIGVQGVFKFSTWNDRVTGEPRKRGIVVVDDVELLQSRREVQEHSVRMGRTSQALRLHAWRCVRDAVGGEVGGEFFG